MGLHLSVVPVSAARWPTSLKCRAAISRDHEEAILWLPVDAPSEDGVLAEQLELVINGLAWEYAVRRELHDHQLDALRVEAGTAPDGGMHDQPGDDPI